MKGLLPELCSSPEVPELMKKVVEAGGLGVSNAQGFYNYTPEEAKRWEKRFLKFSYDVRALALKHSGSPPISGKVRQRKRRDSFWLVKSRFFPARDRSHYMLRA